MSRAQVWDILAIALEKVYYLLARRRASGVRSPMLMTLSTKSSSPLARGGRLLPGVPMVPISVTPKASTSRPRLRSEGMAPNGAVLVAGAPPLPASGGPESR